MTGLFKAVILYLLAATALTLALHEESAEALWLLMSVAIGFAKIIGANAIMILPVVLPILWWFGRGLSKERLKAAYIVAIASICLQIGFLFFKSAIPLLVPFYADPFWARADQILLFGRDGWEVAHAITPEALTPLFPYLYLSTWSALAYAFPILVAASDPDDARALRYVWLFFLSWVVTGNIAALAGSSVGPVFYDQLAGSDRFAALHLALAQSGMAEGPIGLLQDRLWAKSDGMLSFISAFPSVHVSVATVVALYARERFPRFQAVGVGFFLLILLISVHSGYHYLVDGLASVMIVVGLNALLVRHAAATPAGAMAGKAVPGLGWSLRG